MSVRFLHLSFALMLSAVSFSLLAQDTSAPKPHVIVGTGWSRVEALPTRSKVHIYTDHGSKTCRIYQVTEETLTCTRGKAAGTELPRAEIQKIKMAHYGQSAVVGGVILGAAGAITGGVLFHSSCPSHNCWDFITGTDGAAAFGVGLGIIGAAVGGATDFTRGGAIYVRP